DLWGLVAGYRFFADPFDEGVGGIEVRVARMSGPDHLDQRQDRRRVEEVEPDDAFGALRRLGDLRDRERRGVRREDRVRRDGVFERGEGLLLDLEVLEYGLDPYLAPAALAQ